VDAAAVDPTNGDLYYVYGTKDATTGENRLAVRRLTANGSGGLNIGVENFVTDQVQAALPSVAVATNGTIGVLYDTYDGTDTNSGLPVFTTHLAQSTDHGATFAGTALITFLSPARDNGDSRQRVLGDYQQLRRVGTTFFGAFSANGAAFGRSLANIDAIFLSAPAASVSSTTTTTSTTATTRTTTTTTSTTSTASTTTSTTTPCAVPSLGCPQAVAPSGIFVANVMVNVGSRPLGAYSFTLTWDHTLVTVTSVVGGSTSQFSSTPTCNIDNTTSTGSCSAFQTATLTAPTGNVDVAHVNLTAVGSAGSTPMLTLTINSLFDTQDIAMCVQPATHHCSVIIELCGDVNGDRVVNIGDALVVAQYTVGLRQCGVAPLSNPVVCDVNLDSACNIGDALRMAQCDVGLISCAFSCRSFTCP